MLTLAQIEDPRPGLLGQAPENERTKSPHAMIAHAFEAVTGHLQFGKNLVFAIACADDERSHILHPEEARLLSPRAAPKRRLNWTLGRTAARLTLKQLGFEDPPPVLRGEAGEPIWPAGISGSITHCYPWSVAVSAQCSGSIAIGIDLESLERFGKIDVSDLICRKPELEWVRDVSDFHGRLAMIFSAKEALYKSLYPFLRRYVDFTEVELSWSPEQSCFHADVLPSDASCFDGGPVAIFCRRHRHSIFSCSICESKSLPS